MSSLRIDMTSSQPLRLHIDRGFERQGYPWVPTDQGLEVPVKWTQPAKCPADLQVGPKTLSTIPVNLEDLGRPHPDSRRPTGLVAQVSPLDRGAAPPVGPRIVGSFL
jgi:hypothetical protein